MVVAVFANARIFEIEKPNPSHDPLLPLPSFSLPSLAVFPTNDATILTEAWKVFANYLEFARVHDLIGITKLSHQISTTCLDPSKKTECFALMDSVYAFANYFEPSQFKNVISDEHQIVMFTDGPTVAILYFTRDETKAIKVLGMRFCFEDETVQERCVEADSVKEDKNKNGWWDSVESLFY